MVALTPFHIVLHISKQNKSVSNHRTQIKFTMAKPTHTFILLASALCFMSFFSFAYGEDTTASEPLTVEGVVYCDTCNVQFLTKLSKYMEGATVRLECRDPENSSNITLSQEATTNKDGNYNITVDGDHADEICEVMLVKSSQDDCAEWGDDKHTQHAGKLSITNNNGIVESQVRNANPLGFMRKEPLPECPELLKSLGLEPDGTPLDD